MLSAPETSNLWDHRVIGARFLSGLELHGSQRWRNRPDALNRWFIFWDIRARSFLVLCSSSETAWQYAIEEDDMDKTRFPVTRSIVLALATLAVGRIAEAQDNADSRRAAQTQALATWNIIALQTTAAAPLDPPREARAMAIVSAAVFDAMNSITNEHTPYAVKLAASRNAS